MYWVGLALSLTSDATEWQTVWVGYQDDDDGEDDDRGSTEAEDVLHLQTINEQICQIEIKASL